MTILGNVEGMTGWFCMLPLCSHSQWHFQSATSQAITTASTFFFFLRHPLENTDVTGCWNHLLACGTPFKYSFPPPLVTVGIQMTPLYIIYHRGCVLKLKPSTRSFSWDFIYSRSMRGHTGNNTSRVVSSPLRVCLGQPYDLFKVSLCGSWSSLRMPRRLCLP